MDSELTDCPVFGVKNKYASNAKEATAVSIPTVNETKNTGLRIRSAILSKSSVFGDFDSSDTVPFLCLSENVCQYHRQPMAKSRESNFELWAVCYTAAKCFDDSNACSRLQRNEIVI